MTPHESPVSLLHVGFLVILKKEYELFCEPKYVGIGTRQWMYLANLITSIFSNVFVFSSQRIFVIWILLFTLLYVEKNRESQVLVIEVKKSKKMIGLRKLEVFDTFKNAVLCLWLKSVTEESTICMKRQKKKWLMKLFQRVKSSSLNKGGNLWKLQMVEFILIAS